MNKIYLTRIIVTLLVVLSLIFSATSCDLLAEYGIDLDGIIGADKDDTDTGDGGKDDGTTDGNNGTTDGNDGTTDGNDGTTDGNDGTTDGNDGTTSEEKPKVEKDDGVVVIYLPNETDPVTSDPYVNVDKDEFYKNYTPAISYMDAYYRTQHGLMSGSIATQSNNPTISAYQPEEDGRLVRNSAFIYSEDGKTYYVVDAHGNIVNKIYKCGGYVALDEVAAYVFAFGTFPANHTAEKKPKPASSVWGKYLRANHSKFSGDTNKYPNEPELPNITGNGGAIQYYEMDIGGAGYNNGSKITRGALRIVYGRKDLDRDGIIEMGEVYLFYTQNHYEDFREYLNYEGGWGDIFGNQTGGGIGRPTSYVEVAYRSLVTDEGKPAAQSVEITLVWIPKREWL